MLHVDYLVFGIFFLQIIALNAFCSSLGSWCEVQKFIFPSIYLQICYFFHRINVPLVFITWQKDQLLLMYPLEAIPHLTKIYHKLIFSVMNKDKLFNQLLQEHLLILWSYPSLFLHCHLSSGKCPYFFYNMSDETNWFIDWTTDYILLSNIFGPLFFILSNAWNISPSCLRQCTDPKSKQLIQTYKRHKFSLRDGGKMMMHLLRLNNILCNISPLLALTGVCCCPCEKINAE